MSVILIPSIVLFVLSVPSIANTFSAMTETSYTKAIECLRDYLIMLIDGGDLPPDMMPRLSKFQKSPNWKLARKNMDSPDISKVSRKQTEEADLWIERKVFMWRCKDRLSPQGYLRLSK